MTDTPSTTLAKAADALEAAAATATPGPWVVSRTSLHMDGSWGRVTVRPRYSPAITEKVRREADAEWLALMSPAVAAPLVAWLRSLAASMYGMGYDELDFDEEHGFDVARAILAAVGDE